MKLEMDRNYNPVIDNRKYGRITKNDLNKIFKHSGDIEVVVYGNGSQFFGLLEDISASGISIVTNHDIPESFFIGIKMECFGVSFNINDFDFNATVKIVRKNSQKSANYKYGMIFHKLSEKNFDFLKQLYIQKVNFRDF